MPVRKFGVVSSRVRVNIGACGFTGAASFVALLRPERTGGENSWCSAVDSGKANANNFYDCIAKTAGKLGIYRNGVYSEGITTAGLDNNWLLLGISKAAGTVKPNTYVWNFTTKELTKAEGGVAQTDALANVGGFLAFGQWGTSDQLRATYAAAAGFNKAISEAEFKALAEATTIKEGWLAKSPSGLWMFNQKSEAESITDLTGNGANQAEQVGTEYLEEEPPIPYEPQKGGLVISRSPARGLIMR